MKLEKDRVIFLDAGNTSVKLAVSSGLITRKTVRVFPLRAAPHTINSFLQKYRASQVYMVSTNVSITKRLRSVFTKHKLAIFEIGREIQVPMRTLYGPSLGQDRLLGVFSASRLYTRVGMVISFGSAVTIDFLSKRGVHRGGFIIPGLSSSFCAMQKNCPSLSRDILFRMPKKIIASTTEGALQSGIFYGVSLEISGIIKYFRKRKQDFRVVASGGDVFLVSQRLSGIDIIEPYLNLEGLRIIYREYRSK